LNKRGKILITGARGQLGSDVGALLKAGGFDTIRCGKDELDIADRGSVFSLIKREAPHIIVNCAAYTKVDLAEKEREKAFLINEEGARNVALASQAAKAVLIHISTDFVFDGSKSVPYKEEDRTGPLGVYGLSKLAGEEAIRETCPEHIILRTSWLYGVHGANFVKTILRLAREKETLRVVNDQRGSPTWTVDLANVITRAAEAMQGTNASDVFGLYHYSDEGVASWYDFALAIIEEARGMGMELKCRELTPIPTTSYPTPAARPAYSVLNTKKIQKALVVKIPQWQSSLRGMLKELLTEGGREDG